MGACTSWPPPDATQPHANLQRAPPLVVKREDSQQSANLSPSRDLEDRTKVASAAAMTWSEASKHVKLSKTLPSTSSVLPQDAQQTVSPSMKLTHAVNAHDRATTPVRESDQADDSPASLTSRPMSPADIGFEPESATDTLALALLSAHARERRLRELDVFVLDNSVRETTVGQMRGHTISDKHAIMQLVRDCGIKHQIVATFPYANIKSCVCTCKCAMLGRRVCTRGPCACRVDDMFAQQLQQKQFRDIYADQTLYCFSEVLDSSPGDGKLRNDIPLGLQRAAEYDIRNIIFEMDLMLPEITWESGGLEAVLALLKERIGWFRRYVNSDGNIFVNLRDFADAWMTAPQRIHSFLTTLSSEAFGRRITGVMFEDPAGNVFPFNMAIHVGRTRVIMDGAGWTSGHLLLHVHFAYGLAEAVVLESLACGATGIWCGISREGAAVGHANSLTTLCNLHRLGNQHVISKYSMPKLREAAIRMTELTTGASPHPMTELYGSRALDVVFDGVMASGPDPLPGLFEVVSRTRITSMATPAMFRNKLTETFGVPEGGEWPSQLVVRMHELLFHDLSTGRKEEYDSLLGIFSLYERAGGVMTPGVQAALREESELDRHPLLLQLIDFFVDLAGQGEVKSSALAVRISYQHFYDVFLAKYLSCFSCDMGRAAFRILDVDKDGFISVSEVTLRAKWVLKEFPHLCTSVETLIQVLCDKYLLPEIGRELWNTRSSRSAMLRRHRVLALDTDVHVRVTGTTSVVMAGEEARGDAPAMPPAPMVSRNSKQVRMFAFPSQRLN